MLEKVQYQAARMVPGLEKHQYENRLKLMNLSSLAFRKSRGCLRPNDLGYRIVNLWNSLPKDVVSAESVNCFEGLFDRLSENSHFPDDLDGLLFHKSSVRAKISLQAPLATMDCDCC